MYKSEFNFKLDL